MCYICKLITCFNNCFCYIWCKILFIKYFIHSWYNSSNFMVLFTSYPLFVICIYSIFWIINYVITIFLLLSNFFQFIHIYSFLLNYLKFIRSKLLNNANSHLKCSTTTQINLLNYAAFFLENSLKSILFCV